MAKRPRKQKPTDQMKQITLAMQGPSAAAAVADVAAIRRHFSPDEHIAWVEDNCYRDTKGIGWRPLRYSGWQKSSIRKLFAVDDRGVLVFKTIMPCFPRRCDKTGFTSLYDLHRAMEYDDQTIVIQGNSEEQGGDTVLKNIIDTIRNSPKLAAREKAGEITILTDTILFNTRGSIIKIQPSKEASTYGQKISVYHNTELCKAPNDSLYQVGASSTGDSWCGLSIIDSNMGDASNAVNKYVEMAQAAEIEAQKASEENRPRNLSIGDPSIGCVYIHFADLADVLKRGCGMGLEADEEPIHHWLDADWVRSRFAQMTRSEFLRNHCNIPSGAGETLWTDEQIAPLFVRLPMVIKKPVVNLATLLGAGSARFSSIACGVGLDRASAFSKMPDRTVLSLVGRCVIPSLVGKPANVYDANGEAVAQEVTDGSLYVLLGAWEFMRHLRDPLQDKIAQIDALWGIDGMALEAYQASDLAEWCETKPFGGRTRLEHMTTPAKKQLVEFFHGLVTTRRFIAPLGYSVLRAECTNYKEDASSGTPSYGGKRRVVTLESFSTVTGESNGPRETWIKDDYLEATLWAIDAARDARPRGNVRVVNKPDWM